METRFKESEVKTFNLLIGRCLCMSANSTQSCLTLCNRMDCSPRGSSVHGTLQMRKLDGLPCLPPGDLPDPRNEPLSLVSPALTGIFY